MNGHNDGGGNSERWLLTYADMITLLMVFFIVMYAISEMDKSKYEAVASALNKALGGGNLVVNLEGQGDGVSVPMPFAELPTITASLNPTADEVATNGGEEVDPLESIGQALYADFVHDGRFTVRISDRGLIISLVGSALFDSGQADIRPQFLPLLDAIVDRIRTIGNDISVEGFADSDPIRSAQFPSNWELSAARANQVRDYLEQSGVDAERLIVVGYGATRPVFDNRTAEGKAKNRRVDIVILRHRQSIDFGQEIKTVRP